VHKSSQISHYIQQIISSKSITTKATSLSQCHTFRK